MKWLKTSALLAALFALFGSALTSADVPLDVNGIGIKDAGPFVAVLHVHLYSDDVRQYPAIEGLDLELLKNGTQTYSFDGREKGDAFIEYGTYLAYTNIGAKCHLVEMRLVNDAPIVTTCVPVGWKRGFTLVFTTYTFDGNGHLKRISGSRKSVLGSPKPQL